MFLEDIAAQKKSGIILAYDYSLMLTPGWKMHYPVGFDMSYTKQLKDKINIKTGFSYIRKSYDDNNYWSGETFERRFIENMFLFNTGLYYSLFDKKFSLQIGINVIPNITRFKMVAIESVSAPQGKEINNLYSLGVGSTLKIDYALSQNISLSFEPRYTYYLIGDYKKYDFFNTSIGIIYYFK
jgi:hypothetical protein